MLISTIDTGNKIIILGGRDQNNAFCRNIEIFDPKTGHVELYRSNVEFESVFNPCVHFRNDTIVALGLNNAKRLQIIQYRRGDSDLSVLADLNR